MNEKEIITHLKNADFKLSKVIDKIGILDYNSDTYNHKDHFSFLVKEIVGQMISASVKKVLLQRLLELCENNITPNSISKLTVPKLRSIGISNAKSNYILNLANTFLNKDIDFDNLINLSDKEIIKALTSIKGIGIWTSKMYLIFFLKREDILPYEDGAFLQAYKWLYNTKDTKPESIMKKCKKWSPYSSIGARYLYKALDNGLTKMSIKEFLNS